MRKRITAILLAAAMSLSVFTGCAAKVNADNLTDNISRDAIAVYNSFSNGELEAVNEFTANLLGQSFTDNKNTVISPLSVLYALAMTANGADGETLKQMEEVFGIDINTLNNFLYSTVNLLPSDEGYTFDIANSVWIKDDETDLVVNEDFLKTVKNYYDAGIFKEAFDNTTLKNINNWVTQKTNGQIQNVLDRIDPDAVMYLVNAINFEADWQKKYEKYQVNDGTFTKADGTEQTVEFMHSNENNYLEDENTTGFIRYYKDRKYAFVALLPDENTDIETYVDSLNGKKLTNLLENKQNKTVYAALPKFETTFETEMSENLKALGMTDAFDSAVADFSKMGTAQQEGENLCINRVIHKAFIRVAEKGTQAGAATVVEMVTEGAMLIEDPKEVTLDRPFIYMIIDCQNNLPLFTGVVCEI